MPRRVKSGAYLGDMMDINPKYRHDHEPEWNGWHAVVAVILALLVLVFLVPKVEGSSTRGPIFIQPPGPTVPIKCIQTDIGILHCS